MNDTELCQQLVELTVQKLGEIASTLHRQTAIQAFHAGDDRGVKLLALVEPYDRFLDSLAFLCGARKLAPSNPITAFTTVKESIKALADVSTDREGLWNEVRSLVLSDPDLEL